MLWRPFHGIVFWSILVLGACIRLSQYFQRRSLYIDEATLALSIASRPFLGLLRPLDYDQLSPVPFLWAVRAVTMVAGVDELTLRGVSLVSGLVLLLVLGSIARRLFPAEVTLWIVALAALNPSLIHYSNELKPYILDALVAAALILWALDVLRGVPGSRRRLLWAGALAVWVSVPACLVLAGIALVVAGASVERDLRNWSTAAKFTGVWGFSFALAYLTVYRRAAIGSYMQRFWEQCYIRLDSLDGLVYSWAILLDSIWGIVLGAGPSYDGLVSHALALSILGLSVVVLCLVGAAWIARAQGARVTALLLGPILAMLGASAAQRYPIATRLLLFELPIVLLLVGAGILASTSRWRHEWRAALLVVLLAAYIAGTWPRSARWELVPFQHAQAREAVEQFERYSKTDEPVYVSSQAIPIWAFYTTDWRRPDQSRLQRLHELAGPAGPAFGNAASRGPRPDGEGKDLILEGERREILGVPTGMQWIPPRGFARLSPDSRWSRNEATRIRAAAQPGVWLCFFHFIDAAHVPLLQQVEALGGQRARDIRLRGALLFHYEF
ncbi:MAG: hypothetical protein ACREMX_00395 [Gemmatimonadales bacterium]